MTEHALDGIRVLDLTQVMAGPYCTMILADLGADVIKIERPQQGDHTRTSWGRPEPGTDSAAFYALNRNKRSVCLDLDSARDRERFFALVRDCDVVVENFRPGVTKKLGVDYESVAARNPGVVYASISGFGQYGPYAQRPGYDLIAQGMAGAVSVTGEPDGRPVKCGLPIGDLGAGLFAAVSILGACLYRQRTGVGQYVETSLYEAVLAMSVWESTEYWRTGQTLRRLGSANRMSAPYEIYQTRDGYISIGANNQRLWQRMCAVLERDDLLSDDRFAYNADRMDNRGALAAELERTLCAANTAEWVQALLDAGVPCGPIEDYARVLDEDPHVAARDMVRHIEHPVAGMIKVLGSPMKLAATPASIRRPPPVLGEHTDEVIAELARAACPETGKERSGE